MRLVRAGVLVFSILVGACGGTPVSSMPGSPSPSAGVTPVASINPLFGTWRRIGSCQAFVDAMRAAGLAALIGTEDGKWMAGGVAPKGSDPSASDYCLGATPVAHSHSFAMDGAFASFDENGQQVDDGSFVLRGSDEIDFGFVRVRYALDASDHLSFVEITAADRCAHSGFSDASPGPDGLVDCSADHAWAISAFYPGSYERVR